MDCSTPGFPVPQFSSVQSLSHVWLFFFFYFTILYWFCHTSTCICHGYTRVPHPEPPYHLPHVQLFVTPWITARQASLSITNSWSSPKLMSIESVMPSSHLILCCPLLLPQSLPASGSFPMSQLFAWGGQIIGVSASTSFLPKKSQGWSPSEWTGWISLQSKGLSRVFCNTTVQKHQFFGSTFRKLRSWHPVPSLHGK